MISLAIDTSSSACSACIYDANSDAILACKSEEIGKGHAERLIDLIDETLSYANYSYHQLDRIITSIGPGSFTGARVCVAAARGFGVSLKIPVLGVSNFDVTISLALKSLSGVSEILSLMPAGRGQFYGQSTLASEFANANLPFICEIETLLKSDILKTKGLTLCGIQISEIAEKHNLANATYPISSSLLIEEIARVGSKLTPSNNRPEPLYLRKPDAKPQAHFAIERVS